MAGKTAQRILVTALTLFNERGESGVTSVDIAMELDISPGNLYYHFKGKEVIVEALLDWHKKQMHEVLASSVVNKVSADEFFYYLHIVLEKLQLFRFFYRSPADLAEKYPKFDRIRRQMIGLLESSIRQILEQCAKDKLLIASQAELTLLTQMVVLIMTQSNQYDQLQHNDDEETQLYHALSLLLTALMPRFRLPENTVLQLTKAIHHHTMANGVRSAFELKGEG